MKSIQPIIITLIIIGIVLGIGFIVLQEFETTIGTDVGTTTNESIGLVSNDSWTVVANNRTSQGCFKNFAVTTVYNGTNGNAVSSGNYTTESYSGSIKLTDAGYTVYNNSEGFNVTYTYTFGNGSVACDGIGDTIDATATIPAWLTIIVLILIVGIILFIVFTVFPKFSGGQVTGAEGSIAQI